MKHTIDLRPYVATRTWKENIQERYNHVSCPAGEDTRQRLYIKAVTPPCSYVGYCHNCGNYGSIFDGSAKIRNLYDLLDEKNVCYVENYPMNSGYYDNYMSSSRRIESTYIKVWLYTYHIWEEDWDIIPVRQWNNCLLFKISDKSLQFRLFTGDSKYQSFINELDPRPFYYGPALVNNEHVVLCEDVLSAYRVERDAHSPTPGGVASLGTNLRPELRDFLCRWERIHVWYDNDSTGLSKSIQVARELQALVGIKCKVYIVQADKSPKEYTPEELQKVWKTHLSSI